MKPRFRKYLRVALPSLIILPAMTQFATAAIFVDDPAGNAEPTVADNGANTIRADGGASANPFVNIINGVIFTGDVAETEVVEITAANYTVTNAGLLQGTNHDGINSTFAFSLVNSGTIDGNGVSSQGVASLGGTTSITNSGTIEGDDDAISFATDGGFVTNTGTINGAVGALSDGVFGFNNVTINNNGTGTITGVENGVDVLAGLNLVNQTNAIITGTNSHGVLATDTAVISNSGLITGSADGINAGPGATITNSAGAIITGGQDGIDIDGLGNPSSITNAGTISGGTQSAIAGSDSIEVITNSGLIQGGTSAAISLEGDNDIINLNLGSRVIGDVYGGLGNDILNLNGGLTNYWNSASGINSNSILGDVLEFDVINKDGSGVAFIGVPGDAGYTVEANTINITDGGLYINGDILADTALQTTINAGGAALGGTGLWDADVLLTAGGISAGAIPINLDSSPTNAVGTLNLDGNVTHSAGTFIRHDMVPNGADDLIIHTGGTYDLGVATDVRLSPTDINQVVSNGTYTVVSSVDLIGNPGDLSVQFNANVGDSGSFTGSLVPALINSDTANIYGTVLIDHFTTPLYINGDDLVFTVDHDFAGLPGLSDNQSSLGAALDASVNNGNVTIQDFIAALDYSDLGTVQATLASLVPDGMLAQVSAIASSNYRLHRLAQNHLAMTRSSGGTIIETPASYDAKGGMIPGTTSSSAGGSRGNVWGTFSYDWKESDYDNNEFEGEDASFTAGVDYRIANDWLIGIMLDGSQGDYDYNGGSSEIDSLRVAVYGTYGQSTGLYADFLVGYGTHDIDSDRNFGGILFGSSSSSTEADSLQAMLTIGYAMQSGSVKHGPYAGLEYQNIDADGYTQDSILPLDIDGFDYDSLRLLVGYRAEASFGNFTPYASVAYAHEFEDDGISATATLPGGERFQVDGGGLDSAILISLGTRYAFTPNLGMHIGYNGELSTGDGVDSNGGSIGLNYTF